MNCLSLNCEGTEFDFVGGNKWFYAVTFNKPKRTDFQEVRPQKQEQKGTWVGRTHILQIYQTIRFLIYKLGT